MAQEQSRFFDSVASDRQYAAEDFAEYFRTFLTSGVFEAGTNLQVSPSSGLVLAVGYGAAMLDGYGFWLKDDSTGVKTVSLVAANTLPRKDRIVVRLDKSVGTRLATIAVKTGTPAASPSAPALTRAGNIFEISLAVVAVGANVLSISAGNITDERTNNSVCGIVEPIRVRDYLNQSVKTTDSPTFASATIAGTLSANKVIGTVYQ